MENVRRSEKGLAPEKTLNFDVMKQLIYSVLMANGTLKSFSGGNVEKKRNVNDKLCYHISQFFVIRAHKK